MVYRQNMDLNSSLSSSSLVMHSLCCLKLSSSYPCRQSLRSNLETVPNSLSTSESVRLPEGSRVTSGDCSDPWQFPEACLGSGVESSSSSGSDDGVYWDLSTGRVAICLDPCLGGMSKG